MDGTQGCIKYIVSRQSETVTRGYLTIENRELEIDFYITKLYNVTDKNREKHDQEARCNSCTSPLLYSQILGAFSEKGIFCGNRKILARMRSFVVMTELLFM